MALCFTYRPQLSAERPLALVPPKVAHVAPIPLATRAGAAARRRAARPSCVDLLTAF